MSNAVSVPRINAERSVSFWKNVPSGDLTPFMEQETKDYISDMGDTFLILGCNLRENTKHGPCWMVNVEYRGQQYTIPFSQAEFRDDTMHALKAGLRELGGPIESTLVSFDTNAGHGWRLAAPNYIQQEIGDGVIEGDEPPY